MLQILNCSQGEKADVRSRDTIRWCATGSRSGLQRLEPRSFRQGFFFLPGSSLSLPRVDVNRSEFRDELHLLVEGHAKSKKSAIGLVAD